MNLKPPRRATAKATAETGNPNPTPGATTKPHGVIRAPMRGCPAQKERRQGEPPGITRYPAAATQGAEAATATNQPGSATPGQQGMAYARSPTRQKGRPQPLIESPKQRHRPDLQAGGAGLARLAPSAHRSNSTNPISREPAPKKLNKPYTLPRSPSVSRETLPKRTGTIPAQKANSWTEKKQSKTKRKGTEHFRAVSRSGRSINLWDA